MDLSRIVTSPVIKNALNAFAFTEQAAVMLSGVLKSERAIKTNSKTDNNRDGGIGLKCA